MATIEFWFDFISPYAYLAWSRVHELADRNAASIEPHPVLFAGLLEHWGQLGPAEIPPKRMHTFKQVVRRAHDLGVPLSPPTAHPFNPLLGLRLASLDLPAPERRRLIDTLYAAVWAGGPGITDEVSVSRLLDARGLAGASLIDSAKSGPAKQRLIDSGRRAISAGVFGVPTMIVEGELFWGVDDLGNLERYLRGEDPVSPELSERWRSLPGQPRPIRRPTPE